VWIVWLEGLSGIYTYTASMLFHSREMFGFSIEHNPVAQRLWCNEVVSRLNPVDRTI